MGLGNFGWVKFYEAFADRLLDFRHNRRELLEKIGRLYSDYGVKLNQPTLNSDIDPFTIFGMFNKGIKNENRIALLEAIAQEFGLAVAVPAAFDGVPVLMNLKATFYWWQDGDNGDDIENLWELFAAALAYADNPTASTRQTFIAAYDTVLPQKGIAWNITIALYWIRPRFYLNLDKFNCGFLLDEEILSPNFHSIVMPLLETPPQGAEYLQVVEALRQELSQHDYDYKEFPELSHYAYISGDDELGENKPKQPHKNQQVGAMEAAKENSYSPQEFLAEVYMTEAEYRSLVTVLRRKKNIILQGAPGVGKTFIAKRLAYSMMGEMDTSRVDMVQFHQSYTYEDFIMGFRPTEKGFELRKGVFYNFCKRAQEDSDRDYFFIIDEINRGNLSKIFGELFMLLEADKRGDSSIRLLYEDEQFSIPENLYIIGMMNTADRSLALMDYALRRRFAFVTLAPQFDSEGFRKYQQSLNSPALDRLVAVVQEFNAAVAADENLGSDFVIGHSYFCVFDAEHPVTNDWLRSIVEYELVPLVREYYFDEPQEVEVWTERLRGAL